MSFFLVNTDFTDVCRNFSQNVTTHMWQPFTQKVDQNAYSLEAFYFAAAVVPLLPLVGRVGECVYHKVKKKFGVQVVNEVEMGARPSSAPEVAKKSTFMDYFERACIIGTISTAFLVNGYALMNLRRYVNATAPNLTETCYDTVTSIKDKVLRIYLY